MPFQFTFSLPQVFANPFAVTDSDEQTTMPTQQSIHPHLVRVPPSPPSAQPSLPGYLKRGWEPSYASTSAITSSVTTRGYLDTPAKYRTLADASPQLEDEHILEAMAEGKLSFNFDLCSSSTHRNNTFSQSIDDWFNRFKSKFNSTHFAPRSKTNSSSHCSPLLLKGALLTMSLLLDLRPAKRRKTVTESIVATAYSAALISTAVGFTVYRL
jgi:hypothetical protein